MKLKYFLNICLLLFLPLMCVSSAEFYSVNTEKTKGTKRIETFKSKIKQGVKRIKKRLKAPSRYRFPLIVILGGLLLLGIGLLFTISTLTWLGIIIAVMGGILIIARFVRRYQELEFPIILVVIGMLITLFTGFALSSILASILTIGGLVILLTGIVMFSIRLWKALL